MLRLLTSTPGQGTTLDEAIKHAESQYQSPQLPNRVISIISETLHIDGTFYYVIKTLVDEPTEQDIQEMQHGLAQRLFEITTTRT